MTVIDLKSYDFQRCKQAEEATVGAAMISDNIIPLMRVYMSPNKFNDPSLGDIFSVVCFLADGKKPVDIVSVSDELRQRDKFDSCGGRDRIMSLIDAVAFAGHGEHYAKIAAGYYYEREIIKAARAVAMEQTHDLLEKLRVMVLAREQLGLPATFDYKNDLYDILDAILTKKGGKRYDTGFATFDRQMGGISPGEVVTWGAATNTGKSLILLNIASHCSERGESVLYVGTEMSAKETVARHLSILTAIEPHKIRTANISKEEVQRLHDALSDRMSTMPMRILDLPEPSLGDVESALSAHKSNVVFLDYLERFKLPAGDNYRLRVNDFMRQVKSLARRYDVVIHLASQLSREVYSKEESRPTLAHLSESSSIEKESDRVFLVWAPKAKNQDVGGMPGPRVLEAIMAKNRHGRRGLALDLMLDEKSLRITEANSDPQERMI